MSYADKKRTARRILEATPFSPIIVFKQKRKFRGVTQYNAVFGNTVRGKELIGRDRHLIAGCFDGAGGESRFLSMIDDEFFEESRIAA